MVVKSATDGIVGIRRRQRTQRTVRQTPRASVQEQLVEHILVLRMLACVIVASADALHDRNAGAQSDIGLMLQRCCSDPLRAEIHRMDALLSRVSRGAAH